MKSINKYEVAKIILICLILALFIINIINLPELARSYEGEGEVINVEKTSLISYKITYRYYVADFQYDSDIVIYSLKQPSSIGDISPILYIKNNNSIELYSDQIRIFTYIGAMILTIMFFIVGYKSRLNKARNNKIMNSEVKLNNEEV